MSEGFKRVKELIAFVFVHWFTRVREQVQNFPQAGGEPCPKDLKANRSNNVDFFWNKNVFAFPTKKLRCDWNDFTWWSSFTQGMARQAWLAEDKWHENSSRFGRDRMAGCHIRIAEFRSETFSIPSCKLTGYQKLQFSESGSVCNRKISSSELFVDLRLCKQPLSSSVSSKVMWWRRLFGIRVDWARNLEPEMLTWGEYVVGCNALTWYW